MTLQYHSLMLTTTAKQILDCTISYIKVQHPRANLKKEILQKVLCLKKIHTKQNMKNSYNQKTIFSKKKYNHINMWHVTHHFHYLRKTQWMSVLTLLRKSVIIQQAYNYYKSVWHNSLEIKAVKRWLLSCSYMIQRNIKILIKHMFHLFFIDPGESSNPNVTILPTEWVNALPGKRVRCSSQQTKPAHNPHTS